MLMLAGYEMDKMIATTDELVEAWNAGKDFKIFQGRGYCSIRDIDTLMEEYDHIWLRALLLDAVEVTPMSP